MEDVRKRNDADWEGLGISSLQFNPLNPKLLLCVTHKNLCIEIWDVSTASLIKTVPIKGKIHKVWWSLHNPKVFICISELLRKI